MGSLIPQATKRSFESARYFSKLIDEKKALFEPFIFSPASICHSWQRRNQHANLRLGLPVIQHWLSWGNSIPQAMNRSWEIANNHASWIWNYCNYGMYQLSTQSCFGWAILCLIAGRDKHISIMLLRTLLWTLPVLLWTLMWTLFLLLGWYPGVMSATINADIIWWTQNYCTNACQFNDMNLPDS